MAPMTRLERFAAAATLIGALATLSLSALMARHERQMRDHGGYGIVHLELAFKAETAARIMEAWGERGRAAARTSLWLDLLFAPAYATLAWGVTFFVLRRRRGVLAQAGRVVLWAPPAAALCDLVENVVLLRVVAVPEPVSQAPTWVAGWAAAFKFSLLSVVLVYWVVSGVAWAVARGRGRR